MLVRLSVSVGWIEYHPERKMLELTGMKCIHRARGNKYVWSKNHAKWKCLKITITYTHINGFFRLYSMYVKGTVGKPDAYYNVKDFMPWIFHWGNRWRCDDDDHTVWGSRRNFPMSDSISYLYVVVREEKWEKHECIIHWRSNFLCPLIRACLTCHAMPTELTTT